MFFLFIPKIIVLKFIRFYQHNFSPDHSHYKILYPFGYCKFNPTCSEYAYQAIDKHGLIKGGRRAIWRLIRCNPFSKGGYDPIN